MRRGRDRDLGAARPFCESSALPANARSGARSAWERAGRSAKARDAWRRASRVLRGSCTSSSLSIDDERLPSHYRGVWLASSERCPESSPAPRAERRARMLSRESQGQLDGEESDARQRRGAPPGDMIRVLVIAKEGGEADRIIQSLRELPGIALEALHVTSLSDARSHLRETLFDAIVLGLESADPSGLDDLHRLLERASAPVLVFTDSDRPELYSAAIEAGAAECIGKGDSPLTILSRALLQRVRGYHSEQRKAEVHKLLDAL